jgi:hypothetical protein
MPAVVTVGQPVSGQVTEYKAWHQTKLFAISGSRSTSIRYQKDLVAVHAVAVADGDQATETPCGLAVLADVTGADSFDLTQASIRCEMCTDALERCAFEEDSTIAQFPTDQGSGHPQA